MPLPDDPVKWAVDAFRDGRNRTYDTCAAYMDGDQPLALATETFRSTFGRLFEAFFYNRAEAVVDAHADRLRVEGIAADDRTLANQAQEMWDRNRMDLREGHAEADAFGLGDAYLIVEMHPQRGDVHFWVQDPRTVRVHYADDVPGELDLAAKMWIDPDLKRARLNLYFRDRVEKYVSTSRTVATSGVDTPRGFTRYEVSGEPWPMPLGVTDTVPVFHVANNGRTNAYGRSELRNVLPLQDAVNYTLMTKMVGMEFGAYPQRVMIGVDTAQTDEEKAMLAAFRAGLNRIMTLEDPSAKIAEFTPVDLGQYLAVAEFWDVAISRVTKVPRHYLGMSSGEFPSGRALRLAEINFTGKLRDRTKAFGEVYTQAVAYALRLDGRTAVEPGLLRVNWAPVEPTSEEDVWDLILAKRSADLPLVSALREAGYDTDQIATIEEEKRAALYEAERAFGAGVPLDDGDGNDERA